MTQAESRPPEEGARNRERYALIGAGPMGLAMAKTLVEQGVPFQGFELHSDVGGLWDIEGPRSTMYETAHLISSKRMTEFADFPMEESVAEYPSHRELKTYFQRFADHFDLRKHFLFETEILRTEPLGGSGEGWRVAWRDKTGETHEDIFAGVVIANGTLSTPNMPRFKGSFAGEMIHSSAYRHPSQFDGKRVLVVSNAAGFPHAALIEKYTRLGYDFAAEDIITSRATLLAGLDARRALHWGLMATPRAGLRDLEGLHLTYLEEDPGAYEAVDGFLLIGSAVWTEPRQELLEAALRRHPRPVLVGNPDIVAPRETGFSPEPGHFAHRLAEQTGIAPEFFGKPFRNIFDLAFARLGEVDRSRIVMVGDSTHDLIAGRSAGMQTVAVLTGLAEAAVLAPYADAVLPDIGHLPAWLAG